MTISLKNGGEHTRDHNVPHYPKGGRCQGCAKRMADCSALPFDKMPVHRRDGTDVVVICTEFRQLNHGASLRAAARSSR